MPYPPQIRVMTIDSQPLVHGGVRHLLGEFADIELVAEAYDHCDAVRVAERSSPDIVLVEIADLGPDWQGALGQLDRALPMVQLVVFTTVSDAEMVRGALQTGANGYLLKNVWPLSLAQALRSIAGGQRVLAPEASDALIMAQRNEATLYEKLTLREREVLTLLVRGLSNKEIGLQLHVSTSTVKYHCASIFWKLGVKTRAQAVVRAYEGTLIPRRVERRGRAQRA